MHRAGFGIERLDELFRGLKPGESAVWQIHPSTGPGLVAALRTTLRVKVLKFTAGKPLPALVKALHGRISEPLLVDLTTTATPGGDAASAHLTALIEQVFLAEGCAHFLVWDNQFGTAAVDNASCVLAVTPHGLRIDRADGRSPTAVGLQLGYEIADTGAIVAQPVSAASLLGRGLRALRHQRNWSQAELGGLIGVSGSAIGQAERGVHALSLESILEISERSGVSIDRLIGERVPAAFEVTRADLGAHGSVPTPLSPTDPHIELITSQLPPRGSTSPRLSGTHRAAMVLVAQGHVVATMPSGNAYLRPGDALHVAAPKRVSVRNLGADAGLIFWLLLS